MKRMQNYNKLAVSGSRDVRLPLPSYSGEKLEHRSPEFVAVFHAVEDMLNPPDGRFGFSPDMVSHCANYLFSRLLQEGVVVSTGEKEGVF